MNLQWKKVMWMEKATIISYHLAWKGQGQMVKLAPHETLNALSYNHMPDNYHAMVKYYCNLGKSWKDRQRRHTKISRSLQPVIFDHSLQRVATRADAKRKRSCFPRRKKKHTVSRQSDVTAQSPDIGDSVSLSFLQRNNVSRPPNQPCFLILVFLSSLPFALFPLEWLINLKIILLLFLFYLTGTSIS